MTSRKSCSISHVVFYLYVLEAVNQPPGPRLDQMLIQPNSLAQPGTGRGRVEKVARIHLSGLVYTKHMFYHSASSSVLLLFLHLMHSNWTEGLSLPCLHLLLPKKRSNCIPGISDVRLNRSSISSVTPPAPF